MTASGNRPDVGAVNPGYGSAHGFDLGADRDVKALLNGFALYAGGASDELDHALRHDGVVAPRVHEQCERRCRGESAAGEPRATSTRLRRR